MQWVESSPKPEVLNKGDDWRTTAETIFGTYKIIWCVNEYMLKIPDTTLTIGDKDSIKLVAVAEEHYKKKLRSIPEVILREDLTVPILKGVGKKNGDGFKDTTLEGEIVFVWNKELPRPYKEGQYPRINKGSWSASTEQYDFYPATLEEVQSVFREGNKERIDALLEANNRYLQAFRDTKSIIHDLVNSRITLFDLIKIVRSGQLPSIVPYTDKARY